MNYFWSCSASPVIRRRELHCKPNYSMALANVYWVFSFWLKSFVNTNQNGKQIGGCKRAKRSFGKIEGKLRAFVLMCYQRFNQVNGWLSSWVPGRIFNVLIWSSIWVRKFTILIVFLIKIDESCCQHWETNSSPISPLFSSPMLTFLCCNVACLCWMLLFDASALIRQHCNINFRCWSNLHLKVSQGFLNEFSLVRSRMGAWRERKTREKNFELQKML